MLRPETETDLAEMIRGAHDPLSLSGGGTRGITVDGTKLTMSALKGISLYEPGALTLVAQAGTPLADIDAALAAEGQRLSFEPMDHRVLLGTSGAPTIGGVIAANVSGPRRIQGGAARDFALGVRFVDGQGAIIKNGGRVMKNVTGYDLVKLMAGSFGTLGALTEVSLKVLPVPETLGTLVLRGLDDLQAIQAMSRAMGSPYEVTGAADGEGLMGDGAVTALRIEGFEESVKYRLAQLESVLSDFGGAPEIIDAAASADLWSDIRDVRQFADAEGDVWRVACKPSDGAQLAAAAGAEAHYFDWAGGLIWLRLIKGTDLRSRLGNFEGHATLVRGDAALGRFQPEAPGVERLAAGLRQRLDPRGIFNRGLMGAVPAEVA